MFPSLDACRALLLVLGASALAACASEESMGSAGGIDLNPGGRAEGRAVVPAGTSAKIRVVNIGPGSVDFVLRKEGGAEIAHGLLTGFTSELGTVIAETTYVLVLEAHDDAPARVNGYFKVMGASADADISWTVTR